MLGKRFVGAWSLKKRQASTEQYRPTCHGAGQRTETAANTGKRREKRWNDTIDSLRYIAVLPPVSGKKIDNPEMRQVASFTDNSTDTCNER